jgi:galactonate dehydratase
VKISGANIYLVKVGSLHPVLLELLTDSGITGVGEAAVAYGIGGTAAAGMIKDLIEALVLGRDPFRIEELWSDMYDHSFWAKGGGGTIVFAGLSAIEQAMWDIKGRALDVPVYEMLGGKLRDDVRVYANGWSYRCLTADDYARAAERPIKDGYTALKCYPLALPSNGTIRHVSRRSVDREFADLAVKKVRSVRDAVGPGVDIMVDLSGGLTTDESIRLCRRLEDLQLLFVEEPVDPSDLDALRKFSANVKIPVALGERVYTRFGFRPILESGAVDVLQPDIGNTGGIMETKKIAALAETYNTRIQPHVCASPISTAAALQLDACTSNVMIQEVYPYRSIEHFRIVDYPPEHEIRGGRLAIPNRPGLGVNLIQDQVKPFMWAQCKI